MDRIKTCLIGCGKISSNHLEAIFNNRLSIELTAICDKISENSEKALGASSFSSEDKAAVRRYTDYHEMLQKEKPQLVTIATGSGSHVQIAFDVISAGSNLIVEKPIALSLADADAMIIAARKQGVLICPCHQYRFIKPIQKVRKALDLGRFGRLFHGTVHIRWNRGQDYYKQAPWRGTWAQDGGAMMNQCIHSIDLLRWMMGDEISEVMAYTDRLNHPYMEAEDLGLAIIKFKKGSYGLVEGTTNIYPKNLEETFCIFGENGTVKIGGKSVNVIEEWLFRDNMDDPISIKAECSEPSTNVNGYRHTPLYADVAAAIREGCQPYIDGEAGRRALELVLAIYKSAREGRAVQLPLLDYSTMDTVDKFCARQPNFV